MILKHEKNIVDQQSMEEFLIFNGFDIEESGSYKKYIKADLIIEFTYNGFYIKSKTYQYASSFKKLCKILIKYKPEWK